MLEYYAAKLKLAIDENDSVKILNGLIEGVRYCNKRGGSKKKNFFNFLEECASHIENNDFSPDQIVATIQNYYAKRCGASAMLISQLFEILGSTDDSLIWAEKAKESTLYCRSENYETMTEDWICDLNPVMIGTLSFEQLVFLCRKPELLNNENLQHKNDDLLLEKIDLETANTIVDNIEKKIRDAIKYVRICGSFPNEIALEKLIKCINVFVLDKAMQEKNRENLPRIYKKLLSMDKCNDVDSKIIIDIYNEDFRNLCNIHVFLPIEGIVTGIYFLEKYYPKVLMKNTYMSDAKDSRDIDPIDEKKHREDINRKSSLAAVLKERYNVPISKYRTKKKDCVTRLCNLIENEDHRLKEYVTSSQIAEWKRKLQLSEESRKLAIKELDNFLKKEVSCNLYYWLTENGVSSFLDLIEYIEYDFANNTGTSGNSGEDKEEKQPRLKKKINLFNKLLPNPPWATFDDSFESLKADKEFYQVYVFLKSALSKECNLSKLFLLQRDLYFQYNKVRNTVEPYTKKFLQNDIIQKKCNDECTIENFQQIKSKISSYDFFINGKPTYDNIYEDILRCIFVDQIRRSLQERKNNTLQALSQIPELDDEQINVFRRIFFYSLDFEILSYGDLVIFCYTEENAEDRLNMRDTKKREMTQTIISLMYKFLGIDDDDTYNKVSSLAYKFSSLLREESVSMRVDNNLCIDLLPSPVLWTVIMQLCLNADKIILKYPTWYRNTRKTSRSLMGLLREQSNNENFETRRLLSYILERQLYRSLGHEQAYDAMLDARILMEEKISEALLVGRKLKSPAMFAKHIIDGDKAYQI